jgi:regulation of enolase protein 1 (concanavalin A-like superfamily)
MKCGVEYVNGVQQASAVVTRDFSDWSVTPLQANPTSIWLRITANLPAIEVHYSLDGQTYTLLRMAYLTEADHLQVGLMCCSPDGEGFDVTFEAFSIQNLPSA